MMEAGKIRFLYYLNLVSIFAIEMKTLKLHIHPTATDFNFYSHKGFLVSETDVIFCNLECFFD